METRNQNPQDQRNRQGQLNRDRLISDKEQKDNLEKGSVAQQTKTGKNPEARLSSKPEQKSKWEQENKSDNGFLDPTDKLNEDEEEGLHSKPTSDKGR